MSWRATVRNTRALLTQNSFHSPSNATATIADVYKELESESGCGKPMFDHKWMLSNKLCKVAAAKKNIDLNRYSNIVPMDSHRFLLSSGVYINASNVTLDVDEDTAVSYTIAQGPMHPDFHGPDTTGEFWECVFEGDIGVIAMLATVERGFSGCCQYWPSEVDHPTEYGAITVTKKEEHVGLDGGAIVQTFVLHRDGEMKTVYHVQFLTWPNYGVPGSSKPVLGLCRLIQELRSQNIQVYNETAATCRKVLVHCSGGIGRSGSLVTILAGLTHLEHCRATQSIPDVIDILPIVRQLRTQRHPWMVEGLHQYEMCLQVLCDAAEEFEV